MLSSTASRPGIMQYERVPTLASHRVVGSKLDLEIVCQWHFIKLLVDVQELWIVKALKALRVEVLFLISFSLCTPKCSSSCDSGMQIRSVECVDSHGSHNTQCDPASRPPTIQSCATGISCSTSENPLETEIEETLTSEKPTDANYNEAAVNVDGGSGSSGNSGKVDDGSDEENEDNGLTRALPKQKSISDEIDDEIEDEDEDDDDMQSDDPTERSRSNHNIPMAYQYRIPRAERLVDPNAPNEPT